MAQVWKPLTMASMAMTAATPTITPRTDRTEAQLVGQEAFEGDFDDHPEEH